MAISYSLILGPSDDMHVAHMRNALLHHSRKVICIDTAKYPNKWELSWHPSIGYGAIQQDDVFVEFDQIRSVYWRSVSAPAPQCANPIISSDCASMLRTLFCLPHIHWVNSREAIDLHKVKPMQLHQAKSLGATIPRSYIGNDAVQAIGFLEQVEHAIFKPVHGGAQTQTVNHNQRQIEHLRASMALCPVTLQEYIEGTNIRTFVIGKRIFSAEICSNEVDFRSDQQACAVAISTPPKVAQLAQRIMRYFKMQWTAIDWRRDLDGHYYFLEANPSPMFIDLEMNTGLPITESLLELLMQPNSNNLSM